MVSELIASLIIAIVQGLTEWLPVSSSGHLAVFENLLQHQGGLLFDVALHFGTLMAVFVYFGGDIIEIIRDFFKGKWKSGDGRLGLLIIIATIPAAIIGFILQKVFEVTFGNLEMVAFGFAITGIFLIIAGMSRPKPGKFSYSSALLVGIAQIFALFPGVSRSGSTIGAGMLLGLTDKEAVKFSFLMSIPIIFGANVATIGQQSLPPSLIWATLVSFLVGLGTIYLLYGKELVNRKNMKWFGLYAIILAILVGAWVVIR